MEFKFGNVFFFHTMNCIGGVETYFYELAKKYGKDYELVFFYVNADKDQLARLRKYAPCYKYSGQKIKCTNVFFNYTFKPLINTVEADCITEVIHANYMDLSWIIYNTDPRINRRVAVSKSAAEAYKERTGYECGVVSTPLAIDPYDRPPLFLCAAQRMTKEKGFERIKALVRALDGTDIKYYLLIFTDKPKQLNSKNVAYMPSRIDVRPFIASSDIFLVLSDTEGRCYSACEKLSYGNGVLLMTPLPSVMELGCNDSNSIILNFDLSNMDEVISKLRDIYESRTFDSSYEPLVLKDEWPEFLSKNRSSFDRDTKYLVKAMPNYKKFKIFDNALGRIPEEGEEFVVPGETLFDRLYFEKGSLIEVLEAMHESKSN